MILSAQQKQELLLKAKKGEKIARLCRQYGISRFTFYKWLARWQHKPESSSLEDGRSNQKGARHWKGSSGRKAKAVLEVVSGHPQWSSRKIALFLSKKDLVISNHGVQGILERNHLSLLANRKDYQRDVGLWSPWPPWRNFPPRRN